VVYLKQIRLHNAEDTMDDFLKFMALEGTDFSATEVIFPVFFRTDEKSEKLQSG
jgi:hypothetical protein